MIRRPISQYDTSGGDIAALVESVGGEQTTRMECGWLQAVLRSVCAGSAGVVILVSGYEPYLPHVGTSPAVVDERSFTRISKPGATRASSSYQDVLTLSVADQAGELLAALSLNKSQLADVLGVSRPTLYDWLDGKEPNPANAERIASLLRLLARAGVTASAPLNARFVRQPPNEDGPSLLEVLSAEQLDEDHITALLRATRELGDKAESRRRSRENRLRALGYDEPADEQRKEQLARNVAMREWPKP
jgi:transcriptional regulator with XRE-family HTH domain